MVFIDNCSRITVDLGLGILKLYEGKRGQMLIFKCNLNSGETDAEGSSENTVTWQVEVLPFEYNAPKWLNAHCVH